MTLYLSPPLSFSIVQNEAEIKVVMSWRDAGGKNNWDEKSFLEKAVKVALSLATKLDQQRETIHERDVNVANIVVTNTRDGEANFIRTSYAQGSAPVSTDPAKIYALGRVLYSIFAREPPPPSSEAALTSLQSSLRFDEVWKQDEKAGHEDPVTSLSRPQRRRRHSGGPRASIRSTLEAMSLPSSVCRLLTDMLDNEHHAMLILKDNALTSMGDVVDDLTQMDENPGSFLHDSLLRRWKPVISNKKLYYRDAELARTLEVAGRVSWCGTELDDEEEHADMSHEVLMVPGHSGG